MPANKLQSINGVEIFAAGTWNGADYEVKDLDEMVRAFDETKGLFKPYLKLGHNEDQDLLAADGLPAAGWIGKIYRIGEKLFADFVDIPQKIYELIENKAYRKVSSEIYWNLKIGEKKYPYLLSAVALLGADTPAVTTLNDILSMYGLKYENKIKIFHKDENEAIVKLHSFIPEKNAEEKSMQKTEAELKLELELAAQKERAEKAEAEAKKFAQERADQDVELAKLRQEKADADKKAHEAALKAEEARLEAFVTNLVSEKIATPAMKPLLHAILGARKEKYSVKVNGKDEELTFEDSIKTLLKLHTASDVNTEEGSEDGQETKVSNSDDALDEKITKYMDENKCSYKQAYKAVTREHQPRASVSLNSMAEAAV